MRDLSDPLTAKRLYITDLAERLETMESAGRAINAVAYRLFARRLRATVARHPRALLGQPPGTLKPCVLQALAQRHFELHGVFDGPRAERARRVSDALLWRLTRPQR